MFDVGFSEIVVIFAVALIVLGPTKLPKVAQTIGRWVGRARVMARQFRDQLEQEADQFKADTDLNPPPKSAEPPPVPPPPPPPPGEKDEPPGGSAP
jgi:Tat protein translocase TatB subunit